MSKLFISLFLFLFFLFPTSTYAFNYDTFVTVSNPVVGYEGWSMKDQKPLDLPRFQYQESTHSALPVTWLLRYDAVTDATISAYFDQLIKKDVNQYLGAYLEITPHLAFVSDVAYPEGFSIHNANRVFLSGYTQSDRILLIDSFMDSFFNRFGFYPKSVAAWHLDSFSLQYLQSKYSVLTAMNCDDQYSMDHYRLWGGYLGSPYFPDKNNALIPASSSQNRINLAMVRWAQRDLYNFYGDNTSSLFSVQINDYLALGKSTKYLHKLLYQYKPNGFNELGFINIGLENGYSLPFYRQEIANVYRSLKNNSQNSDLRLISLSDFGDWLKIKYPESSPTYFYRSKDPSGSETGEVFWYQSPFYRIGLKSLQGQTKIIDFRVYNREIYEEYFATPNQDTSLYTEIPAVIDSVKYPDQAFSLDIDLSQFETVYDRQWDLWQISLKRGDKLITFYPKSISFTNIKAPVLSSLDIKLTQKGTLTTWTATPHTPLKDNHQYSWLFWFFGFLFIVSIIKKIRKGDQPITPIYLISGFLIIFLAGLTVFNSGQIFPFGLGFFGPNGHDAIFHLSLIEKFSQSPFNFNHPQFSGAKLTNYHFVFDYFSGVISRVFQLLPTTLYFIFLPLVFGFILVRLLGKLMDQWQYSPLEKFLGFFLVFLAGSFGFIPKLLSGQSPFSGESVFWANQSASLFLNPPYVLSLIFLLLFLINLPEDKKARPLRFLKLVFLGALLAQTKVYAFVLLVGALVLSRQFSLSLAIGTLGILFTLPFSSFTGSPFIFEPLWFARSLFASYDRLYWPRLVSAWQTYEAAGRFMRLLAVNFFATIIFLLGNLGIRSMGLFAMSKDYPSTKNQKLVSWIIILGLVLPLLIIQKVNPWNTIQFAYYSLFFLGLFSAKIIARLANSIKSPLFKYLFLIAILFIGSLTSIGTLKDYFGYFSSSRISFVEMRALEALKNAPKGIVISPLFKKADQIATPKPLYSYVSTAYISAFSGQTEFLSDTINLDITGFSYTDRSRDVQRFYNTKDKVWAKGFLAENKIKYIYETPLQKMAVSHGDLELTKLFDSGEITIYQTK